MNVEKLTGGNYYHIYNRGNNRMNLFSIPADFEHFLWLYDKYISPVADTLAWVLMPNHLHLLVYIKKDVVYKYTIESLERISPDKMWFEEHKWETENLSACAAPDNVRFEMIDNTTDINADRSKDAVRFRKPIPYRHFSHLFNAYSRYLQIRTGRTGNLFERPFKRKHVENESYLKQVILYIHNNPIHHGFCTHPLEYSWSSYITSLSDKPTKLKRDAILKLFGNKESFEYQHKQKMDIAEIEKWLEIAPLELHDFDLSKHDADRCIYAVRSGEEDLSAFAEPDNVERIGGTDYEKSAETGNVNDKVLKQQIISD